MLPKIKRSKKLIYLDHAATTPLDPNVERLMRPFWSADFGNPASLYALGQKAKASVEAARQRIAEALNCRAQEIIFTAGGSESVNMAIFGAVREYQKKLRTDSALPQPHIITSKIEHHAVLESFKALEQEGVAANYIAVDKQGFLNQDELFAAIRPGTVLISIILANNEIGTIQDISGIARQLAKINQQRQQANLPQILLHTDACQAAGALELDVHKLGADLLSLNGSKVYGPKQIGLLYKKANVNIVPLIYGGGQEFDLRSGTENVPAIVGFAEALRLAEKIRAKEARRLRTLRNYFGKKILKTVPDIYLNGPGLDQDSDKRPVRLPGNLNFSLSGIEGETLMLYLDAYNVAVATGSACATAGADLSHVILALGRSPDLAAGTIRITFGRTTKKSELDYVSKIMPGLVKELRRVQAWSASEDYRKKMI